MNDNRAVMYLCGVVALLIIFLLYGCTQHYILTYGDQVTISNWCARTDQATAPSAGTWPTAQRDEQGNLFITCGRGENDR